MEIITVELICGVCGNTFTTKRECHNMLEAELLEHKLQRRRKPICPDCYRKSKNKEAIERAAQLQLPEIIGRTDKQIAYAFSLRDSYICAHRGQFNRTKQEFEKIHPYKIPVTAIKYGLPEDECVAEAFRRVGLYQAYICLAEINAQIIIDNLAKQPKQ